MRRYVAAGVLLWAGCRGTIGAGAPLTDAAEVTVEEEEAGVGARDASSGRGRDSGGAIESGTPSSWDGGEGVDPEAGASAEAGVGMPDPITPTPGTVPVFVAVGYGTRRVVSCDFGQSWVNDEADIPNGDDDGYLVRGLGAGGGKFVAAVGGGGSQQLFTSDDGVSWTRIKRDGNGYSDVAYGNGRFVAGGGHVSVMSLDGLTWMMDGTMGSGSGGILRHLAFGSYNGGRFVAVGDKGRRMSSMDGVRWTAEIQEGPDLNGVDYGAGVFVAISRGSETRYSEDGGATWKSGNINGASEVRGILYDGKRFLVTTTSRTFTSTDGKSWQGNDASGGPSSLAVSDDGKHYAGAEGGDLYHSTDGIRFTRVKQGGQLLTRVKFQRVKPSSVCK